MAASEVQTTEVLATEIADVKMIVPRTHRDRRGFFSETYNKGLDVLGAKLGFVQDNHSLSVKRGLVVHFQIPPFAQDRQVRYPGSRLLTSITFAFRDET
jgi:dTDP-4-dehydrorhamnose 3,5-epimerase-like enzyme